MNLKKKSALVTGGAMGIGFATAKRLLNEGCTVTLWDINEQALQKAQDELKQFGTVFIHVCDVTDKNRVKELANTAYDEMGSVDILVNNAGFVSGGYIHEGTDEAWEKTIDINLTALVHTIRAFLPKMYEHNFGYVINLSSASSTLGVPGLAVYTATKWAVWGLNESLRFEARNLKKNGVVFSSVHPSYIAKGMFEGAQLGFLGNLIVPLIKDHDVIAKAIVEKAIKKKKRCIMRPWTVNLTKLLRGILPDTLFQNVLVLLGIPNSMSNWKGRTEEKKS